ncbi:redoxin family protein [Taibaiella lutea]|uniref:Redoxin family protein n=1 Tax=Taibaiella lutea TaxID=2608001 RepID=A0A5M6CNT6_9BACT|nr:redoxin family protein [Taibaiella lutea]KAA5536888.1 redoxin family protein [Taibaiella lutea]
MKKILSLFLAAGISMATFAQEKSMPIGTKLPAEGYQTTNVFDGKIMHLPDVKTEKGLLVVFTCNTCPFVIRNIERTGQVLKYAHEKGLGVVFINSNEAQRNDADAVKSMIKFGKEHNYPNYLVDKKSALADIFGASHTPEVYLFNGAQALVYKGAMDDNPANPSEAKIMYLKNAIDNLLAGKAIDPAETKSVGCSIKRLN